MELSQHDLLDGYGLGRKSYARTEPISGVEVLPLQRFVDDRGLFMEIYRAGTTHAGTERLQQFFAGVPVAQLNYSLVTVADHVKGLHYHLKQDDVWFVPPPSKAKFVLFDVRKASPTFGKTQVVVAGGGQDVLVRIPAGVAHGYRPLTNPCALLYFVTESFDPSAPDELRIAWDHPAVRHLWEVPNG